MHPSLQFSSWLITRGRASTNDTFEREECSNHGPYQLCKREPEAKTASVTNLMFHGVTLKIWIMSKDDLVYMTSSLVYGMICQRQWIKTRWHITTRIIGIHRKLMISLIMHTSWEVWSEQNTWVFTKNGTLSSIIRCKMKYDMRILAITIHGRVPSIFLLGE